MVDIPPCELPENGLHMVELKNEASVQKSENYIMQLERELDTAKSQPSLQSFACIEKRKSFSLNRCRNACTSGIPLLNISANASFNQFSHR